MQNMCLHEWGWSNQHLIYLTSCHLQMAYSERMEGERTCQNSVWAAGEKLIRGHEKCRIQFLSSSREA